MLHTEGRENIVREGVSENTFSRPDFWSGKTLNLRLLNSVSQIKYTHSLFGNGRAIGRQMLLHFYVIVARSTVKHVMQSVKHKTTLVAITVCYEKMAIFFAITEL